MTLNKKIGIIIPCYNEQNNLNITSIINTLEELGNIKVVFVNDGSSDNTGFILKQICSKLPEKAGYIDLAKNMGKGEAVRTGFNHLLKDDSLEYIAYWDADMAVPLCEIEDFINILESHPEVMGAIGSRVNLSGRNVKRSGIRHLLGRVFITVINNSFKIKVYDSQCGAKVFRREVLTSNVLEPFSSRWIFDVEILLRISALSFVNKESWLYEVPVKQWINSTGSKCSFSAYIKSFFDYIKVLFNYKFGYKD